MTIGTMGLTFIDNESDHSGSATVTCALERKRETRLVTISSPKNVSNPFNLPAVRTAKFATKKLLLLPRSVFHESNPAVMNCSITTKTGKEMRVKVLCVGRGSLYVRLIPMVVSVIIVHVLSASRS